MGRGDRSNGGGGEIERWLGEELERLAQAALGGRVAHTSFLEPDESAVLLRSLHDHSVPALAWGGFPGARRRVVTAYPEHLPEATTPLAALYFEGIHDGRQTRELLMGEGAPSHLLGDAVSHRDGISLVVIDPPDERLLAVSSLAGWTVEATVVPLERAVEGTQRRLTVVVPSLRVDVIGAKGFKVSRSYFAKGVAGGKVSVNGRPAGKSASAEPGDEVYAEGLGRLRVLSVDGETRRGNVKVSLEVEIGPR